MVNVFTRAADANAEQERQRLVMLLHEFAQSLTAMQAALRQARCSPALAADAELALCLCVLAEQQQHLHDLLQRAQQQVAQPHRRLQLASVLDAACLLFAPHCAACAITTRVDALDDAAVVQGDPLRLRQALLNLLHNAGNAIAARRRRDGEAAAGCIRIALQHDAAAAQVRIHIEDDGIGYDPSTPPGTGLCLVREVLDAHRGTLTLAPLPDGGTRATVALPRSG